MARPHIEFIQTQKLDWMEDGDGSLIKCLNRDDVDGADTCLVHYPSGFHAKGRQPLDRAEEYYLLEGQLRRGGKELGFHAYGFDPRGLPAPDLSTRTGATLLRFRYGRTDPDSHIDQAEPIALDTPAMPWDVSTYDPKLSHLRLARKVLRLGPNNSCRTFLLTGMPHGVPNVDGLPAERHAHAEEMFMLSGEMWAPEGLLRQGSYFYRPAGIVHGPHVSAGGFFQIMRSPGTNAIKTDWAQTLSPLPIGAPFNPRLPEGSPAHWREEWTGAEPF